MNIRVPNPHFRSSHNFSLMSLGVRYVRATSQMAFAAFSWELSIQLRNCRLPFFPPSAGACSLRPLDMTSQNLDDPYTTERHNGFLYRRERINKKGRPQTSEKGGPVDSKVLTKPNDAS